MATRATPRTTTQWVEMPLLLDWQLSDRRANFGDDLMHSPATASAAVGSSLFPLTQEVQQRLINLLPIKQGDKTTLVVRPNVARDTATFAKGAGTLTEPRGIFHIENVGNNVNWIVEVWGNTAYIWTSADAYTTDTLGTIDGPVGFVQGHQTDNTRYAVVSSSFETIIITNPSGVTTSASIVDADFPAEVVPTPVYLDGYLFIASMRTDAITYGSRRIYNSAVGDPFTWAASTFTQTEETGGMIVALAKHKKSVVALCTDHIEFFRNAGVAAPNSPLLRQAEYLAHIGCINRATVTAHGDDIYFAGIERSGSVGIYRIRDYKVEKISTPSVDTLVRYHGGDNKRFGLAFEWTLDRDKSLTDRDNFATGYMVTMYDKVYYCFSTNAGVVRNSSANQMDRAPVALLYDPELRVWIEVAYRHEDTGSTITQVAGGWFPYGCAVNISQNFGATRITYVYQNPYGGADDHQIAVHHPTSRTAEILNADGGFSSEVSGVPVIIQWPLSDFGTPAIKSMSGISINELIAETSTIDVFGSLSLARFGAYNFVQGDGVFYNLLAALTGITLDQEECMYTIRAQFGAFRRQLFQLQSTISGSPYGYESVKFRITVHEEP